MYLAAFINHGIHKKSSTNFTSFKLKSTKFPHSLTLVHFLPDIPIKRCCSTLKQNSYGIFSAFLFAKFQNIRKLFLIFECKDMRGLCDIRIHHF